MARKSGTLSLNLSDDFAFFSQLHLFYRNNRKKIRATYQDLTRKFLDFNDPDKANAFLRLPQFEALEMYVFLKEYLENRPVHELFELWRDSAGKFEDRDQLSLFESENRDNYDALFSKMRRHARSYSNYIFALTMGTGKTILMATCIFYEFLLANKYPKDERYCHNALVFAPDKTVLQSLREIQTFDMAKVVPPEYLNFLSSHIQFHFLDEAGLALSTLDRSRFNLVISNTQKVILKRQNKEKTGVDKLFGSGKPTYQTDSVYAQNADLYNFDEPDDEDSLTTNQRFEKLRRLEQLGIYIDEAHHAFGNDLAKDMGAIESTTSLRKTVDELAASLNRSGTRVVACYNYTGTPYVGKEILPEVVYAYGLQDAIKNAYLKTVTIEGYANTQSPLFVKLAVEDFLAKVGDARYEGMLPKLAFFAATIDELQKELRPAVEAELAKQGIPSSRILVNVGDDKLTTNDDIREFNQLDTPRSEKQFILLVNKGREGWNCRSLFGVALFRKPKSKIFVLQATMRCLRSITEIQQNGHVYLTNENKEILEDELKQNFRVSIHDLQGAASAKKTYQIHVAEPAVKIKLKRVRKLFALKDKPMPSGYSLDLDKVDREKYKLVHTTQQGLDLSHATVSKLKVEDISHLREQTEYSRLTLVAEIARYLNRSPLAVEDILASTTEGLTGVLKAVNEINELLYDCVVPRLFHALYDVREYTDHEEYEVELVKAPPKGFYEIQALPTHVIQHDDPQVVSGDLASKSFHLDTYCFDSGSERTFFWALLADKRITKLYFTGMLTHGQSDFFVQYVDPDTHAIRSYYPDFVAQKDDGSYVILEVKADNQIDTPVVQAKKDFANQMANASGMTYAIIPSTAADAGHYAAVFTS